MSTSLPSQAQFLTLQNRVPFTDIPKDTPRNCCHCRDPFKTPWDPERTGRLALNYEGPEHVVRLTLCGHVIGEKCLVRWVTSDHPNRFKCSYCTRKLFTAPDDPDHCDIEAEESSEFELPENSMSEDESIAEEDAAFDESAFGADALNSTWTQTLENDEHIRRLEEERAVYSMWYQRDGAVSQELADLLKDLASETLRYMRAHGT